MNFLSSNSNKNRTAIQFEAYFMTPEITFINEFLEIGNFVLPSIEDFDTPIEIPPNLRLGNRLEYFFEHVLKMSLQYEPFTKNVQIIKDKITQGEIDFIVIDNILNDILHIEISNKFYLFDDSMPNEFSKWIGPNRNDNLFLKLTKLKKKQFPLLKQDISKLLFSKLFIDTETIIQKVNIKAQLFIPYKSTKDFSQFEISGFYTTIKQFEEKEFKTYQFFLPEKQDWQVNPKHCELWFDYATITTQIELHFQNNKSPLIWMKNQNNEFLKVFVVWW